MAKKYIGPSGIGWLIGRIKGELDGNAGKRMTGSVEPTKGGTVTAGEGAEVFNDYRNREYSGSYPSQGNVASGRYSHAEGRRNTASGHESHAEGDKNVASGEFSHAEGGGTTASGEYSHAEGEGTTASGAYSHAEGCETIASKGSSHAEGMNTKASGFYSHAEGENTKAFGSSSHAEGYETEASGSSSHAEGVAATASGSCSHAGGICTIASGDYQTVIGKYNVEKNATDALFIIGKGTANSARSNAFRVSSAGAVYGTGSYNSSGADYAEYFEWTDDNPDAADRVGRFVTLDGEKIRLAASADERVIGVVSATPSVIGDAYDDQWKDMYLRDVFGREIYEMQMVPAVLGRSGEVIVPEHEELLPVMNPEYDAEQEYLPRSKRPEWAAVGMLGKFVMVDDGSCVAGGYCKPGTDGIATNSEEKTGCWVMGRIDETHIRVFIPPVA